MDLRFDLVVGANRPIIELNEIFKGCTALLDTGAIIPVWTKKDDLLEALGATLDKKNVSFSGFGGKTIGDLYKIDLRLGKIMYPRLPIVVHEDNKIPGYFIFSATMFKGMIYTIDDITKKFIVILTDNQICHNIKVVDSNGKITVLVNQ